MLSRNEKETKLLEETALTIQENGHESHEVRWVGKKDGSQAVTWEEFVEMARPIVYDRGLGGVYIPEDLVVVGDDWWLERHDYDGSEWWEYKTLPVRQPGAKPLKRVWQDLDYLLDDENGDDDG